jgi:uncharacterized protein
MSLHMATFRFYGPLNDFLLKQQRQKSVDWPVGPSANVKDVIESLGVPHPEIGLLLVNGQSVDFTYRLQQDDWCSVYPHFYHLDLSTLALLPSVPPQPFQFVLDTHLGKLASYLRLLGFDTLYRNTFTDEELALLSNQENRILLTRDRGLLMRRMVQYGHFVRSTDPVRQLQELLERYPLAEHIAPFSRCLVCNGPLIPVEKEAVVDQLPPHVQAHQRSFLQCTHCGKAFWEGTHYQRMHAFVQTILQTGEVSNE